MERNIEKAVLSGNEAVARGAWEAGVHVAVAYPGTPSTEITATISTYPEVHANWCTNEKVALEVAAGAAIGGARALCCMKHVGVNVAADPLFSLSYMGVNAGLVLITADEPGMHSSQNEQDNRHFARAAKVPMLEPSDSEEARQMVHAAFDLSETFDTPVFFRLTTRTSHSSSLVELHERANREVKPYVRDVSKYILLPANARKRHVVVEQRTLDVLTWAKTTPFNRIESGEGNEGKIGFVCNGISYQYVKEAFPKASVLKYGVAWPVDLDIAKRFREQVETLYVVEEGEPFLEEHFRAAGIRVDGGKDRTGLCGEFSVEHVKKVFGTEPLSGAVSQVEPPARPPALCPGCAHRNVFHCLKTAVKGTVFSDIGCYTLGALKPIEALDFCLDMGASITGASGLYKAHPEKAGTIFAALGDSTFLHSGITGLIDAVHNENLITVVVIDNRVTAMTGHQSNPVTGRNLLGHEVPEMDLAAICRACGAKKVDVVNPREVEKLKATIKDHAQAVKELGGPTVIVAKYHCVEWAKEILTPYATDHEMCVGCQACVRLGCPAIHWDATRKLSSIDASLCRGCGLCAEVCKFESIHRTDDVTGHKERAVAFKKKMDERKAAKKENA